jgi:cyclic pyranopterin phosphate synthase
VPEAPAASEAELLALVALLHEHAPIAKVRLTGGEPLLTPDPPGLVARLHERLPGAELGLTTNGLLLPRYAEPLRQAGLELLNVSLDTLDEEACRRLTRGAKLADILAGIHAARTAGFPRMKLNSVLLRTINGEQLDTLVRFAAEIACEIRFIELMPYGEGRRLFPAESLPASEAIERLAAAFPHLGEEDSRTGTARRHWFSVEGCRQPVGFITAVSHPFCGWCDRMRLDSRGRLFSCLRQSRGSDLLTPLRAGRIAEIRDRIRLAIEGKTAPATAWPERPMVTIGG